MPPYVPRISLLWSSENCPFSSNFPCFKFMPGHLPGGKPAPQASPCPTSRGSCLRHPPPRTGLQTKQLRQELRKAGSSAMTCVNFKLCRFHAEDSGYILQAGRCNPRHNSGAFKATQRWFWRCLRATPYCAENSGSFQVCSIAFCCASTWKRVKIPELSLWFLGSWKWWAHLCRQEGATCLPLAKFITQKLQFYPYPGVTHERKRHIMGFVGCWLPELSWKANSEHSQPWPSCPQTTHHCHVPLAASACSPLLLQHLQDTPAWQGTKCTSKARQT